MSKSNKSEEFYAKLKEQLEESTSWPSIYLYKFIVKSAEDEAKISAIFDGMGAVIETKDSSKGTYTSVSIKVKMKSPESVIDKYIEVGEKVEEVISL